MKRTGPDSLEGCFIALTICLISTMMFGIAGLSSFLFVACMTRYNTDRNHASLPFVLNSVIQSFTGPFAGYLAEKFGVRIVVFSGSLLAFLGIGTCFFAESISTVTILWGFVFGIGFGSTTLLFPAVINEYFFKHRSKALGISYLGSPIGFLIFPPVFEILYDKYGLSGTFLFLSGINLHCVPLSLLLRQPNFKEDSSNTPLNYGTEKVADMSTNFRTSHPACSKSVKETTTSENMEDHNSYLTCYSLEFLWKQPPPPELSSEDKEENVLTLNTNSFCPIRRRSDGAIFYEKTTGKSFKKSTREKLVLNNVSSNEIGVSSKIKHDKTLKKDYGSFFIDKNRNNFDNSSELINKTGKDPPYLSENIKKNLKVTEDCKLWKLQFPNDRHKCRTCSIVYFGTNKSLDTLSQNHRIKFQPNLPYINDEKKYNGKVHCCHSSLANSDNQSTSGIPRVSVIRLDESAPLSNNNNQQEKCSNWKVYFYNKSLFNICCSPVFIVMCISNALFSLQFTTLTTVIIDFAKDHNIDSNYDKFIMMCISIMGLCGMLSFGWVTDGGYMRRNKFASLCLIIGSISVGVLPQVIDITTLLIVLAIWCVSQSSFVLLIPAILAEYLEKDIQAVAVSAVHVLCGPLYLIIPPLLGYFRDGKGSYDYVFYLLSSLSLLNSILVFFVPYMARSAERNTYSQNSC